MSAYSIHSTLQDAFLPEDVAEPQPQAQVHPKQQLLKVNASAAAASWDDFEEEEPVYDVEDIDDRVNQAQAQLKRLREEQEAVQILNAKKAEFQEGRAEMIEKLASSATEFEHESQALILRAEAMEEAAQSFRRHLGAIEQIRPEEWPRKDMHAGLDQALAVIKDASAEYETETKRIEALGGATSSSPRKKSGKVGEVVSSLFSSVEKQSFFYWFRSGFAFTLPVIVLGLIALILILTAIGGAPAPAPETTAASL